MQQLADNKHPGYFEAILQLRDITPEMHQIALNEIQKSHLNISKTVQHSNGTDYYLNDNRKTIQIGKLLQERFGGDFQVTTKLHTKKNEKEIYRYTILFRGLDFKKGDIVLYKGDEYRINFLGKDIQLQNIESGKKVRVFDKDIKLIKKIN